MRLLRYLPENEQWQPCVATIGNFDGVHRGHRHVIRHVMNKAQQLQLASTVISFEPLPAEYFRVPTPPRIYPLRDKVRCLVQLQVERFVCLRFNQALATMSAEHFVERVLVQQLQVRYLVVGDDFRFGAGRVGDYALLHRMGQVLGMQVVDTPTLLHDTQRISSSLIREQLARADLVAAQSLLGVPYQLSGRVKQGNRRGRLMGFPTLNLTMPLNLVLQRGVYVVQLEGLQSKTLFGIANLGQRPTFAGTDLRLEVHVFDFDEQVYGRSVGVTPLYFIRAETKFASLHDLMLQIQQDIVIAKTWLAEHPNPMVK